MKKIPSPTTTEHRFFRGIVSRFFLAMNPLNFCGTATALALLLIAAGCEKGADGTIDPQGLPASISNASVSPDSLLMNGLPQNGGLLTASIRVSVRTTLPAGSLPLSGVYASVLSPSDPNPILEVQLEDNGQGGDAVAGDGIFSSNVQFSVSKAATGRFRVQFIAAMSDGSTSNLIELPLSMIRNDSAPVLSNLQAPDTVTVPSGGSVAIHMNVRASDADGQSDIAQVFFRSLDSSDPTKKYLLADDGNINGASGDSVAGDGIYSIVIQAIDSPTVRKTYRFAFQASDAFGDTSATIVHRMTIR
jgi:hypothetical protein